MEVFTFGSKEMTSSLIEDVPPLVLGRGYSWRKLNCKL
jgi:hypothetical protein